MNPAPENLRYSTLLANWYSGATLLTALLDRHPELVSNGEGFYDEYRADFVCSCGAPVRECEFYRAAGSHMRLGDDFDRETFLAVPRLSNVEQINRYMISSRFAGRARSLASRTWPAFRRRSAAFAVAHGRFMENACAAASARKYIDGTKSIRRLELFLDSGLRAESVILLVRDPRDWIMGWRRRRPRASLENGIHTWRAYLENSRRLLDLWPQLPRITLRMEDLRNEPSAVMARLFEFLDVDPKVDVLGASTHTSHLLGHKMRHSFTGKVEPDPMLWKSELDPEERRCIEESLGPEILSCGYSID